MKFKILILTGIILAFTVACNAQAAPLKKESSIQKNVNLPFLEDYNQSKKLVAREYILGANDTILIEFLGIPELSKELKVHPDGKISLTYMENFHVAGKTITEVQEEIANVYQDYLEDPQISIKLVQARPFIVYIAGAVLNPGSYELNTITNQSPYYAKPEAYIERKTPLLSNVLVAAGGLTCDADAENVTITNDLNNSVLKVDLLKLIKDADSSQDIYLMAGDRVNIPKLPSRHFVDPEKYSVLVSSTLFQKTIPVKVVGYVNNPGLVSLNTQQSANLTSAIAQAGGYQKDSPHMPRRVLVSRTDNNNKTTTFAVNPRQNEILLMPNDTVYVPQRVIPTVGKLFDYTTRLFTPFYLFSNTYKGWDVIIND